MANDNHYQQEKQGEASDKIGTIYRASGNLFIAKRVFRGPPHQFINCSRSAISVFSANSGRRMRRYLRECIAEYKTMVTLTYPFSYPSDGKAVKDHLRRFLQELKREYNRYHSQSETEFSEFSAFWFLEFQSRGAPHFHIFATWTPDYKWVAKRWYEIVNSEDIRHFQAGTRTEYLNAGRAGTISYASKYAQKMEQKEVPEGYENVGRFWGITGRRSVVSAATYVSQADEQKSDVKDALKALIGAINRLLFEGILEVMIKDEGVRVLICHSTGAMKMLRQRISLLSFKTHKYQDFFEDAELTD